MRPPQCTAARSLRRTAPGSGSPRVSAVRWLTLRAGRPGMRWSHRRRAMPTRTSRPPRQPASCAAAALHRKWPSADSTPRHAGDWPSPRPAAPSPGRPSAPWSDPRTCRSGPSPVRALHAPVPVATRPPGPSARIPQTPSGPARLLPALQNPGRSGDAARPRRATLLARRPSRPRRPARRPSGCPGRERSAAMRSCGPASP